MFGGLLFEIRAYHLLVLQVGALDKRWITSVLIKCLRPSDPSHSFMYFLLFSIMPNLDVQPRVESKL